MNRRLDGCPVLALGSGVTLLGVLRSLGPVGARVLSCPDTEAPARYSRWFKPAPPALAGLRPEGLESAVTLLDPGTVLMPCSDAWARAVTGLPESIAQRWPFSLPSQGTLETLVDKGRLASRLDRLGLPHPLTIPLSGGSDLDQVPDTLLRTGAFLKPRDSQGFFARFGVKAFAVRGREHAEQLLAQLELAACPMLVQEYIPGPPSAHYFVDGFVDRDGVRRAQFVRRRLRMYPADFGNSTLMVSVPGNEAGEAVAALDALLADVQYRGIFSAEFKRDPRDGRFKLLEVNCRPWWYVEFATRCGVNVCAMAVEDALGREVQRVESYAVGRRCVYPYYDWHAGRAERGAGRLRLTDWARSWIGAYQPVFRWSDPLPAVHGVWTRVWKKRRL